VRTAIKTEAGFIGLVGSRKKKKGVLDKLRREGTEEKDIERISCPAGLSIGAQGPEEIAVSIIAQLIRHVRMPVADVDEAI
jgi:xanthine dehydrogenase accessory factor